METSQSQWTWSQGEVTDTWSEQREGPDRTRLGGTKQRQISKHAKATLPNKNKQNQPTLKRKEHGMQRNDKTLTLKENIIQSTKQNSSAALCTMNQVNENMHSEKYELNDEMREHQEGYRIKEG